ncbi:MAG TPA: elongation factor P--(R)-beta-lysine ligase [Gammaproteobacteria bacterium]|nr:elongation factor P--(R)-beta-lysine ligase [Gammaproteobacteria bacterium]
MTPGDDWRPSADVEALHARARLLAELRAFFSERGVLEVDTPVMAACGAADPHLQNFVTHYHDPGATDAVPLYLQTSPEFAMKRLLAAGSGPIFQICKAFRNGERGRLHNPEFSLLEWYRPGLGYRALMDEVADLLARVGLGAATSTSYREAFGNHVGVDPMAVEDAELRRLALQRGLHAGTAADDGRDTCLHYLWSHCVEPELGRAGPQFVFDFPSTQAMLARIRPGAVAVAERFELFVEGVELANGFQELTDPVEQTRRFGQDNARRRSLGLAAVPPDTRLLAALAHGLPECSGVALGLDRLLLVLLGRSRLDEILAFPVHRA